MCMDDINNMAAFFWLEHGEAPTHLLLTPEQHREFSSQFVPKSPSREYKKVN